MKFWLSALVSCVLVAGCSTHSAADNTASKTSTIAGTYTGAWTNTDGAGGNLRITLQHPDGSPWQATMSFTYDGSDTTANLKSVEVTGRHIVMAYDYEIQGTQGGSEMTGDFAHGQWTGTYKITKGEGEPGTWKASLVK